LPRPSAERDFFQKRYLGRFNVGEGADDDIYTILSAVARGTLAEMSFQIRRVHDKL
jgi:hypothetical protein